MDTTPRTTPETTDEPETTPSALTPPEPDQPAAEVVAAETAHAEPAKVAPMAAATPTPAAPSKPTFTERVQAYIRANPTRAWVIGGAVLLFILSFFVRVPQPHVSLAGEPILANGPFWLTNSLIMTFIVDLIVIILALLATRKMELIPTGLQNLMEAVLEAIYNLSESIAGKAASTYFPHAATVFLFVIVSNWSGLIPGVGSIEMHHVGAEEHAFGLENQLAMANGKLLWQEGAAEEPHEEEEAHAPAVPLLRPPSADLNMTFALAIATMFMVQYYGVRALGSSYWRKFMFWSPSGEGYMKPINGFVSFLELISELSRILTFAFRLFGNIFAGEVVLATMAFLFAFLVPVPFYALEVLVGVIQALVFTMLSLILFSLATISHDHSEEHH